MPGQAHFVYIDYGVPLSRQAADSTEIARRQGIWDAVIRSQRTFRP
jgi:hypothetical protein